MLSVLRYIFVPRTHSVPTFGHLVILEKQWLLDHHHHHLLRLHRLAACYSIFLLQRISFYNFASFFGNPFFFLWVPFKLVNNRHMNPIPFYILRKWKSDNDHKPRGVPHEYVHMTSLCPLPRPVPATIKILFWISWSTAKYRRDNIGYPLFCRPIF